MKTYSVLVMAGISPDEFWRLTPFQTKYIFEQINEKESASLSKIIFGAWHAAAYQRAKTLPGLRGILQKMQDSNASQNDRRMAKVAQFRSFFAMARTRLKEKPEKDAE